MTRRRVVRWTLAGLVFIALLDLAAVARGGFPSKIVGGASVAAGAQPSATWWFAAGRSEGGVSVDLHLLNPSPEPATVVVRYFVGGGLFADRRLSLPPAQAITVATSADRAGGFGGGYPGFSIEVRADRPVVAERTMAWNAPDEHRTGFTTGPGLDHLLTEVSFGAGSKATGHRQWLALLNPGPDPAEVVVRGPGREQRLHLASRDRADVELASESKAVALEVVSSAPVAVERVQQASEGIDVAGPPTLRSVALVPRPFAEPVALAGVGPCPGLPTEMTGTEGAVALAVPCPVEWTTQSGDPIHRDIVAQPAAGPGTDWAFAEWGGPGQTDRLLLFNPGPTPARVEVRLLPRRVLGDDAGPAPPAPTTVDVAAGQSQNLDLGPVAASVVLHSSAPVGAWRIETARRAFVRSYTDPGFR